MTVWQFTKKHTAKTSSKAHFMQTFNKSKEMQQFGQARCSAKPPLTSLPLFGAQEVIGINALKLSVSPRRKYIPTMDSSCKRQISLAF